MPPHVAVHALVLAVLLLREAESTVKLAAWWFLYWYAYGAVGYSDGAPGRFIRVGPFMFRPPCEDAAHILLRDHGPKCFEGPTP